ncbi:MAG: glycosyltransferase [Candidatus Riflebacteria bacterium]|nr:glycosyltransferase [Candidatus Riflebacteria bacterium]
MEQKVRRLCFVAAFTSPIFSGRVASELLLATRALELPVSASDRKTYLSTKDFYFAPYITKVLERPDSGRFRLWVSLLNDLPEKIDKGKMLVVTAFDPFTYDKKRIAALKNAIKVWVPSEAHLKACLKEGIASEKVEVFPMPVNTRKFHPRVLCPDNLKPQEGIFRFVLSACPINRKGIEEVLHAYIKEFKPNEKVELLIKLTHYPNLKKNLAFEIQDLKKKIGALNKMFAKVKVITEIMPDKEYAGLLASSDTYIYAGKTLSSSITIKEAMACALPVITHQKVAEVFGLENEYAYIVPAETKVAKPETIYAQSSEMNVLEIDKQELAKAMRNAFNNPTKNAKMGLKAQRFIKTLPDWKDFASKIAIVVKNG